MAKKKKNKDIFDLLKHTEKFMVGGRVSNYVTDPSDTLAKLQANKAQAMLEGETDFLGNAFGVLSQLAPAVMGAIGGKNGEGWGLINEAITGKPYIKTILPGATVEKLALGGEVSSNVEVEGDEVGITPDGQFLDFKGPDHEQGGINVNLPEGTEMFSKRIKLVKEKGGKKVKKSIADWMKEEKEYDKKIAKKYDSDETDQLMKNTHKRATETTQGNIEKYKSIQKAFQKAQEELNQPIGLPEEMEGEQPQFALGGPIKPKPYLLNNEFEFDPLLLSLTKNAIQADLKSKMLLGTVNNESQDGIVPIDFGEDAPDNNYYPSKMNLSAGKNAKDMLGYYTKEEISDMGDTLDSSTSTGDTKKSSLLDILKNAGSGLDFTLGDALAIGGALKSAIDLKKNVLENRAGDKPNINPYLNYGQDALRTVEEMFNMQEIQKDYALHDAELSRNASVSRNSNSARSINTLNALNLATDQQFNDASGKIYANNAAALQKMMGVKADLQRDIDSNVMRGAADKDMNDRRDRDAFYQNMNEVIKNSGQTAETIGSYLNQMKQAKVSMNLVNELGRHGMRITKNGTVEMIPGWNEKKGDVKTEEKKDDIIEVEKSAKNRSSTLDPSKFSILKDDQKIKIAQEVGYANVRLDAQGNVLGDTIDRAGNTKTEVVIPFTSINDDIKSLLPFKKRKKTN